MGDSVPGIGNPPSVANLASAGQDSITTLEKLDAQANSDVMSTVPDRWGGESAGMFGRFWGRYMRCFGTYRSDTATWCRAITRAAETMAKAKEQLGAARQFTDDKGLVIRDDLVVEARDGNRPGAADLVAAGQQGVDAARRLARQSQQEIRDANKEYQEKVAKTREDMVTIGMTLFGARAGRRGRLTVAEKAYEGTVRIPKANRGEWVRGDPNDGMWKPNRPEEYGLQWPKDTITWNEGVPNLREHTVPPEHMPDGRSGVLDDLRGLNGKYRNDYGIADGELAARFGWTPEQVAAWRQSNDYVYHHYSNSELQLVPGRIHRPLAHEGSTTDLLWP